MSIKPPKFANKNGQHALEYVILMTLIMAGIPIGGPYVIRSWNAQMKMWEDSVTDSMRDPLDNAPPVPIPGCDDGTWVDVTCGVGTMDNCGNTVSCQATEMLSTRPFNPAG